MFDHLRRHPEGGADKGVAFAGGVGELAGYPEVCQLDVPHVAQQYISSLQAKPTLDMFVHYSCIKRTGSMGGLRGEGVSTLKIFLLP